MTAVADERIHPSEKGEHLARALAKGHHLLILDGLEPLQESPDVQNEAPLRDEAVLALLRTLAREGGRCLCVVTTRAKIRDLIDQRHTTAPHWDLGNLGEDAGIRLLDQLRIGGSAEDLRAAVREVQGHPLTLTLMGLYLRVRYPDHSDIALRDTFGLDEADNKVHDGHARRVLFAYEKMLGLPSRASELATMRLVSLFDRPVTFEMIAPLVRASALLARPLRRSARRLWEESTSTLRRLGLLETKSQLIGVRRTRSAAVTAHPIVREYFSSRTEMTQRSEVRQAHALLYASFRQKGRSAKTIDDLTNLYQAVAHGCRAGRHVEAWKNVYVPLIRKQGVYYSLNELGLFEADLSALRWFFRNPWSEPVPKLSPSVRAELLYDVANCSRAAMRLDESFTAVVAARDASLDACPPLWKLAADASRFVSALDLSMGDVAGALSEAKRAVDLADRAAGVYQQMTASVTYAAALFSASRRRSAVLQFDFAARALPRIQRSRRFEVRLWYEWRRTDLTLMKPERAAWCAQMGAASDRDAQYVAKKLGLRSIRHAEHLEKLVTDLDGDTRVGPLYVSLAHLAIAQAKLYAMVLGRQSGVRVHNGHADEVDASLIKADEGIRQGGRRDYRPFSLQLRAWSACLGGERDRSLDLLRDAEDIARRSGMRTILADVLLNRARLFRQSASLAEAESLVRATGYARRYGEVEDARRAAANW
jgi:hypothetical protein